MRGGIELVSSNLHSSRLENRCWMVALNSNNRLTRNSFARNTLSLRTCESTASEEEDRHSRNAFTHPIHKSRIHDSRARKLMSERPMQWRNRERKRFLLIFFIDVFSYMTWYSIDWGILLEAKTDGLKEYISYSFYLPIKNFSFAEKVELQSILALKHFLYELINVISCLFIATVFDISEIVSHLHNYLWIKKFDLNYYLSKSCK